MESIAKHAKLIAFPAPRISDEALGRAVELETSGKLKVAELLYLEILRTSGDARAAINLGTIAYNRKNYVMAEEMYRVAARTDPSHVLAWFNLGNALDELLRRAEAIEAFETAIRLDPGYADAHFNLAITLERIGRGPQALIHWRAYIRLDRSGTCTVWAKRRISILTTESGLRCVRAPGRKRQPVFIQAPSGAKPLGVRLSSASLALCD